MHDIVPLVAFLALFIGIGALIALFGRWERRQANKWTIEAEGTFDRVEHRRYRRSYWSGMMLPAIVHGIAEITIIHLQDGRSFSVDGHIEPVVPQGAPVRLLRNGLGGLKLESLA